jgi:hypothetical protein
MILMIRNIYLYLVAFVTLLMMIFGIIFTIQNTIDFMYPESRPYYNIDSKMTAEDKLIAEANQKEQIAADLLMNKKNIVKSIIVVVITLPVFIYHWRKIEKERVVSENKL